MTEGFTTGSLKEGKEAFRQYVEQEQDPVKQEKLKEFLPFIEKSIDVYDLEWFRNKAIQTADASRSLLDQKEEQIEFEKEKKATWVKRLKFLWCIFIVVGAFVIWQGFEKVYVYTTPDGIELLSEIDEGKIVIAGKNKTRLTFTEEKIAFYNDATARLVGVASIGLILIIFTLVKAGAEYKE